MPPRQEAPPPNDWSNIPVGEPDTPEMPPFLGGVPEDYAVRRAIGYGQTPTGRVYRNVPASFREGAQYEVYQMTPDQVAALQDRLVAAGLLDPNDVASFGFVGGGADPTVAAFEDLLGYANQAGYSRWTDALARLGRNPSPVAAGPQRPGRLPPQVSNPDDLRRVFRSAVIDTLGQGWSEEQINGLVDAYQQLEVEQHTALQEAQMQASEGIDADGRIVDLPNPQTFAETQARQADPVGAQAVGFRDAANQFLSLLGSWRPSGGEMPGA